MRILALDSSGLVASVAVVQADEKEENLIAEYTVNYKKTHSQTLLPMLDEVAKMTETDMESIDAIAVAAGPGSFTGLRIGSATAKGLGLALNKPLIPVPTLEGLAYNLCGTEAIVCPIMDARRGQVYTGIYEFRGNELTVLEGQMAIAIEELGKKLLKYDRRIIFLGDGVPVFREILTERLLAGKDISFAPCNMNRQRAASVAALGIRYYRDGKLERAAEHGPEYLRVSQAERERRERQRQAMVSHIDIREIGQKDIEQVHEIEKNCFSDAWSTTGILESLIQNHTVLLGAWSDGKLMGYVIAYFSADDCEIARIAVDEPCRRKGAALKLLEELKGICLKKQAEKIILDVRQSNEAAISLYKKIGFAQDGIRKNFYEKPPENAVLMSFAIGK